MNKKYLFILAFAFLPIILATFTAIPFNDTEAEYNNVIDPNYEITNYYVEVQADNNRNVYIKETIDVNFIYPRASIIRDIPINNGLRIKDIDSPTRQISVEKNGSFLSVDLDSSNYTQQTGNKQYILTYTMILPKLKAAKDSIPLNVIGHGWGVIIHKAEIDITLPTDPIKSYYYVGIKGVTTGTDRINTVATGNKIKITTNKILQPFEGITVGYDFAKNTLRTPFDMSLIPKIILALLIVATGAVLFIKFGKDEQIYPIINFNANNLNPAQTGYLIDGNCEASDLTALIFYWASTGYLNIIDNEKGNNIQLQKIKPLNSTHNKHEHTIFNALFKNGDTVRISSLKNNFYTNIAKAQIEVKQEYNGKLYNKKSLVFAVIASLLPTLFSGIAVFFNGTNIHGTFLNPTGFFLFIPTAICFIAATILFMREPKFLEKKSLFYILYAVLVFICSFVMIFILRNSLLTKTESFIYVITFGLTMCFSPFIQKRTEYYHEILNNLTGFRSFIKEAEKEKLEMLLKENPQYYYDILPYANVLGVSDIWMKKFQDLTVQAPYWYRSYRPFDFIIFNAAFNRSFSAITTTVVSRPNRSGTGGGGFGGSIGGGFGGGGFGGGGGRSR